MCAISSISYDPTTFKKKGFRFDIHLADKAGGRIFSLIAPAEKDCHDWVAQLRQAQAAYEDHVSHFQLQETHSAVRKKKTKDKDNKSKKFYETTNFVAEPADNDLQETNLFSDFKIIANQAVSDCGSVYIIGGNDYHVTHRSFNLHCIGKDSLHYVSGENAIRDLGELSVFPIFSRQLLIGESSDAIYAIYHPPFRLQSDSLYAWLGYLEIFPEDIVMHLSSQLILALEFIHSNNFLFVNLSPESLFFDIDGNLRIFDTTLTLAPSMAPILSVEYTCPENINSVSHVNDTASDFWRLGVLLYELSVGKLPFESCSMDGEIDDNEQRNFILNQIASLAIHPDDMPEHVSPELCDLICKLLVADPRKRLTNMDMIKSHPFFASVESWDINVMLQQHKPQWIIDSIVEPMLGDPQTPINLTPEPEHIVTHHLNVSIRKASGLPKEYTSRLYCAVNVEGNIKKTKVITQAEANTIEFNERFKFNLPTGGTLPESSDLVIDLISKALEAEGRPIVGSVCFPLTEIRSLETLNENMTILSPDGLPIGELNVVIRWSQTQASVTQLLGEMIDPKRSFVDTFFKPVPAKSAKLWSLIVDVETVPQNEIVPQTQINATPATPSLSFSKTNSLSLASNSASSKKSPFVDINHDNQAEPSQIETLSPASPSSSNSRPSASNNLSTSMSTSRTSNTAINETSRASVSQSKVQQVEEPKQETAAKVDPDDNPANWKTATDAQSGEIYYYNKVTKRTSWAAPPCLAEK